MFDLAVQLSLYQVKIMIDGHHRLHVLINIVVLIVEGIQRLNYEASNYTESRECGTRCNKSVDRTMNNYRSRRDCVTNYIMIVYNIIIDLRLYLR